MYYGKGESGEVSKEAPLREVVSLAYDGSREAENRIDCEFKASLGYIEFQTSLVK